MFVKVTFQKAGKLQQYVSSSSPPPANRRDPGRTSDGSLKTPLEPLSDPKGFTVREIRENTRIQQPKIIPAKHPNSRI